MSHFTIAFSGLTEEDTAQAQIALDTPGSHWSLVDGIDADLLMVDIDSVWGHMDWLRATAGGARTIAYTEQSEVRNGDLMVRKPLKADVLKKLLAELGPGSTKGELLSEARAHDTLVDNHLNDDPPGVVHAAEPAAMEHAPAEHALPTAVVVEHLVVTAPPVVQLSLVAKARAAADLVPVERSAAPASTPVKAAPVATEAELTPLKAASAAATLPAPAQTLGLALLAGEITQPIRIENHGSVLQIDPERGGYHAPAMLKPLQALLDLPASTAQPLDAKTLEQLHLSPALPLARLVWFAALCATPGKLAAPLDRQAVYHLTRWPQIEREFPRHFRIATALMKQPNTVDAIAEAANAPVTDVIDFINAYYVARFIHTDAGAGASDNGVRSRLRRPFAR